MSGLMILLHGSNTLLVRVSQIAGVQGGSVVGVGLVPGAGVVIGGDGVEGVTQEVPGTCHWPAESEQLSTWPFGERQSLFGELSQVPHCPSVFPP